MLQRNIAAASPKNRYDKTNMKVFALSLWKKFSWGITYFGQFNMVHLYHGPSYGSQIWRYKGTVLYLPHQKAAKALKSFSCFPTQNVDYDEGLIKI